MNNRYARFGTALAAVALVVLVVSWLHGGSRPDARMDNDSSRDKTLVGRATEDQTKQPAPAATSPGPESTQGERDFDGAHGGPMPRLAANRHLDRLPLQESPHAGVFPGGASRYLRAPTPAETVRRSSAIVRAAVKAVRERVRQGQPPSVDDPNLVCDVKKVIYGTIPPGDLVVRDVGVAMTVKMDLRRELRREPTPAEIKARLQVERKRRGYYEGERDVMIFLARSRETDEGMVWLPAAMSIDHPPQHSLDDRERKILDVLRTGDHMTLTPGQTGDEALNSFLLASREVVRARLKSLEGRSSKWEMVDVLGVVPGPVLRDPPTPEQQAKQRRAVREQMGGEFNVDLQPWRLRAAALARHQARQRQEKMPTEQEIDKEFRRLVGAELKTGREAILFLKSEKGAEGRPAYQLVGIAHAEPDDPLKQRAFEDFAQTVRDAVKTDAYLKVRLGMGRR